MKIWFPVAVALVSTAACHDGKSTDVQAAPVAQSAAPIDGTKAAKAEAAAVPPATVTSAAPAPVKVEAGFSCPMHADVTAKEPGKCTKCGMALVAKPAEAPAAK